MLLSRRAALSHAMVVRFVGASAGSADRRVAVPRQAGWVGRSRSRRVRQSPSPAIQERGPCLRERNRPRRSQSGIQTDSAAAFPSAAAPSGPHPAFPFARRRSPAPPGVPFGLASARSLSAGARWIARTDPCRDTRPKSRRIGLGPSGLPQASVFRSQWLDHIRALQRIARADDFSESGSADRDPLLFPHLPTPPTRAPYL